MDASTRLYARLGEIPEDPNDPESLADLIVCAFGAFERYYLCWKTKGGDFRQDGYDLPTALSEWLNPNDGTTRDWASLQVVFGRGEEYFASDKHGKLEFKEPEIKRSVGEEEREKVNRRALRRSRTVSFLRPLSQASVRSESTGTDGSVRNKRTTSISSLQASRPPSLSYSTAGSEASVGYTGENLPQDTTRASEPSYFPRLASVDASTAEEDAEMPWSSPEASQSMNTSNLKSPTKNQVYAPRQEATPSSSWIPGQNAYPDQLSESSKARKPNKSPSIGPTTSKPCTCGCHDSPQPRIHQSNYADASMQTDPIPAPPRTSLRVDTSSASSWGNNTRRIEAVQTPAVDENLHSAPFFMGRMTNYFNKPGYQLGDSLSGTYQYYEQPVYYYQDEFGDEALR